MSDLSSLDQTLAQYGQQHLLQFRDELDGDQLQSLVRQIEAIDFELVQTLYSDKGSGDTWESLADRAEIPPAITLDDFRDPESYQRAYDCGAAAIADGQVAMILTAGGQGSRLGFEHPKGMFPIGPVSDRTLYQIIIEKVLARARQFGSTIPFYVMTSPPSHAESTEFLAKHKNFGYAPEDFTIFCQGVMPAVDQDGKMLLGSKSELFVSPDGHGGMLAAFEREGCLNELEERGIRHVFYGQVDNPLIQACDPALLGYHILAKSEMTTQVVRKNSPLQKVGNVVSIDGKVQIIEYSDLPERHAKQLNEDGSLKLWAGSIAVHVFDTEFLRRTSATADALPFHRAHKAVPFVNANGELIKPESPNAIKFERFIFDLLPWAKNAIVCEVDPAEGFCAVKNAPPAAGETPEHVRNAISDLHTGWLKTAGIEVPDGTAIEICSFFANEPNQLNDKVDSIGPIEGPTFLS